VASNELQAAIIKGMNRREVLKLLAAAPLAGALPALPVEPEERWYAGSFDYKAGVFRPVLLILTKGGRCTLNGRTIKRVWFADTHAGIVKTYDVFGDGQARLTRLIIPIAQDKPVIVTDGTVQETPSPYREKHAGHITVSRGYLTRRQYHPSDFPGREVECPLDGVLSETLRGEVRIYGPRSKYIPRV